MRARRGTGTRHDGAMPTDGRSFGVEEDNTQKKHVRKSTIPLIVAVVAALGLVSIALSGGPPVRTASMTPDPTDPPMMTPKNSTSLGSAFVGVNNRLPRIPRRLVFTYKYSLLEGASPPPPHDIDSDDVPLKNNVLRTIDSKWYTGVWIAL